MQNIPTPEEKRENRILLACAVLAAVGIAFRVTELAGMWGAA